MSEVLFGLTPDEWYVLEAKPGSEWFGTWKSETLDCPNCLAMKVVGGQAWCLMGVGKRMGLAVGEKPKKCTLINRETGQPVKKWPPR